MLASSIPPKLPIPWAKNAGGSFIRTIPTASQIGIQNGAASLNDGFVPDNFLPTASGGVPPFGQDMNGILNWATEILQWTQAGGPWPYDATFSGLIGGYPSGAIVSSAVVPGKQWISLVDNNTTNPDTSSSSGWATPPGQLPSGTPVASFSSTVPSGFVAANALTIGDGSSGANTASATMLFLFAAIWLDFPNSQCPILNSDGSPGTRGANPFVDFAAHKRMTLPNAKGCALVGVDTMGGAASTFLSGVPIISGNTTTPGSQLGENLHTLTTSEIAAHQHAVFLRDLGHSHGQLASGGGGVTGIITSPVSAVYTGPFSNTQSAVTGITIGSVNGVANDNQTASIGGGGAHNNVSRSMGVYWNLAL